MDEEAQNTPLITTRSNSHVSEGPGDPTEVKVNFRSHYTLPKARYTNAVRCLVFLDAALAIALWASGGNMDYFVHNIKHFELTKSTFDLALMMTLKCVLLIMLYTALEKITLRQIEEPYDAAICRKKRTLHVLVIIFSFVFFVYPVIKGGFVLYSILNDPDYVKMHLTYNILCISAVVFGLVEAILSLVSFRSMRRLQLIRILHRMNDDGHEVDEDGKPINRKVNLGRLISLIKSEATIIIIASLCLLGSTAASTAVPLFFGKVVDSAQRPGMADLNRTVLILLGINVAGAIFGMFRAGLFTLAGQRIVARLRKDLFDSIIQQEIAFFDTNRTGELTNRLSSDTQVIQNAVTVNVSMLTRNVLQIIGSLVFMFVLNVYLTLVLLAVVPIISLGAVQYGKYMQKVRKSFQDRLAEASTTAEESISNVRTVRSFVGEDKASGLYAESINKSYAEGRKLAIVMGVFEGVIGIVIAGALILALWYGGKLVNEKTLSPGILTSFLLYTLNVAFAFGLLSSLYGDFMQAVGASVRIFELFDKKPEVRNQGGLQLESLDTGLQFDSVEFTYPSRLDNQVLKGVNFHVEKGQMVALVGPSGGGKSTIVSLIERFYDPNSGCVRLSGTDLKALDPQWFRRQMSIVSQEPTLFACSIADNISYGRDAPFHEIEEAARQANAEEFILPFEDKYDTLVGERGVRLSGGQKQRIAIARALLMNPDILLLDEATSALDAESEYLVQEAIDRAMTNRTVLVIAHRLSTVRNADKVIVISDGQIAEEGTHDELLVKGGTYKQLVLRQLTAGQTNLNGDQPEETPANGLTGPGHVTSDTQDLM